VVDDQDRTSTAEAAGKPTGGPGDRNGYLGKHPSGFVEAMTSPAADLARPTDDLSPIGDVPPAAEDLSALSGEPESADDLDYYEDGAPEEEPADPEAPPPPFPPARRRSLLGSAAGWAFHKATDAAGVMTQAAVDIARPVVTPVAHAAGQAALVAGTAAYKTADPALRSTIRAIVQIVLEEVDLNAIIRERVDLDGIIASVDLDAAVSRVDIDGIVATVDLDAVIDRVDIARVIDRVDIDGIVATVDLDAVIDRVDVAKVIDKVDLDSVVAGVDIDAVAGRIDLDAIVNRMDLITLADKVIEGIDLPGIIRDSTGSLGTEAVEGVRSQTMRADDAVAGFVGRLFGRAPERRGEQQ